MICGRSLPGSFTVIADGVAYAFLTPTVIHMILAVPESAEADFSALEQIFFSEYAISEEPCLRRADGAVPCALSARSTG